MDRMFYLSIVYDMYGYNRLDLTKRKRLQDLDEILSEFNNKQEVLEAYLSDRNIDRKKGRLCIVYEDLELKQKELKDHNISGLITDKETSDKLSYAHIIPIMYKNERLMNSEACLLTLKHKLRDKDIRDSIFINRKEKRNGQEIVIKTNKRYLFESDNEKSILNDADYKSVVENFLVRLKNMKPESQYFYFRSLMDICGLRVKEKQKVTNLHINKNVLKKGLSSFELTKEEKLELESNDMDSFYIYHDLDEVVNLSPNKNRPIGSERKKK